DSYKARFLEAMNNDFNTPQAIAVLFQYTKEVNALLNSGEKFSRSSVQRIDDLYSELGGERILGIVPSSTDKLLLPKRTLSIFAAEDIKVDEAGGPTLTPTDDERRLIQLLVDLRTEARANKLWGFSDKIRDELNKLGVILEDKKEGTVWKKSR
ncbi:MAG TPA: DALR domain-containing protein, partial [Candidatus Hodarchaeales archaeon]|nr:DALR domain-containing protein [Candidatus Hodarchaeales archaeon]